MKSLIDIIQEQVEEAKVAEDLMTFEANVDRILDSVEEWLKQFVVTDPVHEKHQLQNSVLNTLVQKIIIERSTLLIPRNEKGETTT